MFGCGPSNPWLISDVPYLLRLSMADKDALVGRACGTVSSESFNYMSYFIINRILKTVGCLVAASFHPKVSSWPKTNFHLPQVPVLQRNGPKVLVDSERNSKRYSRGLRKLWACWHPKRGLSARSTSSSSLVWELLWTSSTSSIMTISTSSGSWSTTKSSKMNIEPDVQKSAIGRQKYDRHHLCSTCRHSIN